MLLKIDELILYLYLSLLKSKLRTTTTTTTNKTTSYSIMYGLKRFFAGKWLVLKF